MRTNYDEIFAPLAIADPEVTALLERMVANRTLPRVTEGGANELTGHARSIAARLAAARPLAAGERYEVTEFLSALRAEIEAKPARTAWCSLVLTAFEARAATHDVETVAA